MSDQPPGSVLELISHIRHAQSRMSVHNPNRALFTVCIAALTDLSLQIAEAKRPHEPETASPIIEGVGV